MADYPALKNASFLLVFPIFDGSGCPVKGGGGLAACISQDGAAFAGATCTIAEINTNAGVYKMSATSTEMNGDIIAVKIVSTSASARDTIFIIPTAASRQIKDLAWPTVAGRSTDVTATGEVGIDWANIGGTSTSQNLSSTTIGAATIANALAASTVGASQLAANAIHAAAIAASSITASKIGANAIEAAGIAASAISACKIAACSIGVSTIAGSAIAAANLAASVIGSQAISASSFYAGTTTCAEQQAFADVMLDRDLSTGLDSGASTVRTVRQALRILRNKRSVSASVLTVTKENDTTASWTASVVTATNNPVSSIDPAG